MTGGYMGKLLWVDLSRDKITEEALDEKLARDYIGGYGIGARLIYDRQKPGIDPLGPDNTLAFITGPLTGTDATWGNRYTVMVGRSPLSGGTGDANSGGDFGPYLKFAGYDAVFVTGAAKKPTYLFIKDGKAELKDASKIWGKDCDETEDALQEELGKDVRIACIGPAGEKLALIAAIINNRGRAAARSGVGAVMGSKKLKAVVVSGTAKIPVAKPVEAKALRKEAMASFNKGMADFFKAATPPSRTGPATSIPIPTPKRWTV
jgi:aldehyde:ferredoxin oxidoreductase